MTQKAHSARTSFKDKAPQDNTCSTIVDSQMKPHQHVFIIYAYLDVNTVNKSAPYCQSLFPQHYIRTQILHSILHFIWLTVSVCCPHSSSQGMRQVPFKIKHTHDWLHSLTLSLLSSTHILCKFLKSPKSPREIISTLVILPFIHHPHHGLTDEPTSWAWQSSAVKQD